MNSSSTAHLEKKDHYRITNWPRDCIQCKRCVGCAKQNETGPTLVHRQTLLALLAGTTVRDCQCSFSRYSHQSRHCISTRMLLDFVFLAFRHFHCVFEHIAIQNLELLIYMLATVRHTFLVKISWCRCNRSKLFDTFRLVSSIVCSRSSVQNVLNRGKFEHNEATLYKLFIVKFALRITGAVFRRICKIAKIDC
jgi:hypothetical protein